MGTVELAQAMGLRLAPMAVAAAQAPAWAAAASHRAHIAAAHQRAVRSVALGNIDVKTLSVQALLVLSIIDGIALSSMLLTLQHKRQQHNNKAQLICTCCTHLYLK